jgi:hypothetical protein
MKFLQLNRLLLVLLLTGFYSHAQTVFVTAEIKDTKEKNGFFDSAGAFSNFSLSVPFRGNPEYGTNDPNDTNKGTWFIPDGISFQGGFGVHATETFALSLNTGIDGLITPKLVAVPVYGSLLINPAINDDSTLFLQIGVGRAFAIGRGDLSGVYQKYRLGASDSGNTGIFIELNFYGFGLYDIRQVSSINIGISIFNFN